MKRLLPAFLLFTVISITLLSCYYDNEEALYPSPGSSCDTANVTFSAKISNILADNCLSCHSNATAASAGNNIRLQDYIDVKARTTAIAGSIKHTATYSPMPKNGGKLKACSITMVDIWIRNGAPEN
ncbi:MAG: hypothetical protein H6Q23_1576 [Bacteroidetes bacterium]|nr:hypothetical protein [Bacteroidota bacterium]